MKFRMFTKKDDGLKCAVNVDQVVMVIEKKDSVIIVTGLFDHENAIEVEEDFHTVLSRLDMIAE